MCELELDFDSIICFTCGFYEPIEEVVIYWDIVFRFIVEYSSLSDFGP